MKSRLRRLNKSIKGSKKRKYRRKKKGGSSLGTSFKGIIIILTKISLELKKNGSSDEIPKYKKAIEKYKDCPNPIPQGNSGAGIVELFDISDTYCLNPGDEMLKYTEGITLKKPELQVLKNDKPVSIFSISDFSYSYFINSPKYDYYYRHSPDLCYDNKTKYLDMLCCLIDLKTKYRELEKPNKGTHVGGTKLVDSVIKIIHGINKNNHSFTYYIFPKYIEKIKQYGENLKKNEKCNNTTLIKSSLLLNEYIIQQILYNYISKYHKNLVHFVINFTDFAIEQNNQQDDLYIVQERIGSVIEVENKVKNKVETKKEFIRITHLLEYIDFFVNIKRENKGKILIHILNTMFGIKNLNNDFNVYTFFNLMERNISKFITDYLQNFEDDSFFKCMRILYNRLGFLHLDFKLKNIFMRYDGFVSKDKNDKEEQKREQEEREDYTMYSCIIADLDKSRLQIDFNKLNITESNA
jgi:hypothetical protein